MANNDDFGDLFLNDLVLAEHHVAKVKLKFVGGSPFLRGLLRRGTQAAMDPEDHGNALLETAIGHASAIGVCLQEENDNLQTHVCLSLFLFVCDKH